MILLPPVSPRPPLLLYPLARPASLSSRRALSSSPPRLHPLVQAYDCLVAAITWREPFRVDTVLAEDFRDLQKVDSRQHS